MFQRIWKGCKYVVNVVVLTITALLVSSASAQTVRFVNPSATGANDGTSWTNAFTDLMPAIAAADVINANQVEIWVAAGEYRPTTNTSQRGLSFRLLPNVKLYGGFSGNGTETSITQRKPTIHVTTLTGDISNNDAGTIDDITRDENSHHVVTSDEDDGDVDPFESYLDGFTVIGGNANSNTINYFEGGGIHCSDGASPRIVNCRITGNKAVITGGLGGGYGGGILATGAGTAPVIINCDIDGNKCDGWGGGVSANLDSGPIVISSTLRNNIAGNGGGMAVKGSSVATITNSVIHDNAANSISGLGGSGNGGGISLDRSGTITVTNCTISQNLAASNGGGYAQHSPNGTLTGGIFNSIIWDNQGAEIYLASSSGTLTVTYSNIEGGYSGTGNINSDPLFVNGDGDNFRIDSDSPCRNTASNADVPADTYNIDGDGSTAEATPDRDIQTRILNTTVDMGAYESHAPGTCCEDINGDGTVDVNDLLLLIGGWGEAGPADIFPSCGGDGVADVNDLLALIGAWGDDCSGTGSVPESLNDCYDLCDEEVGEAWSACMDACIRFICETEGLECDE